MLKESTREHLPSRAYMNFWPWLLQILYLLFLSQPTSTSANSKIWPTLTSSRPCRYARPGGNPAGIANQAKSKMAAILSENCNNSHEICTNWHRMVVLVSKCRFINSRNNINTTKNLYVKYLIAKSKMAAILSEKSKYSHEIWINWPRMVV